VKFIDEHKDSDRGGLRWGVESICTVLSEHGASIAPSTYYDARKRQPSKQELRDDELRPLIVKTHAENYGVYGARKVWLALNRQGVEVARCTVERLMNEVGLAGARRGKRWRTTIPDAAATRPRDLVDRKFAPLAPNRLWVADFTYVATWTGMVHFAFVIDAYSRRILGWRATYSMKTSLVLDALEQAIWARTQEGVAGLDGLIHHTDAGSQYTSIAFTERLAAAGVDGSVGSVGDAYDNALAETVIGLYKTELIKRQGPWKNVEHVELATLSYVDWFNNQRLLEINGDITPAELEAAYYRHNSTLAEAG
jgi:putative transposase